MGETIVKRHGYRSLFWPIVLIGVGVIWLLGNLNIISAANLVVLFRLWPLILIIVGLDLLFGRQSPFLGAVIGIGTVALFIVLMLVGPSIGLAGVDMDIKTAAYNEPLEDATSARVNLNMTAGEMNIKALSDSSDLIDADLNYIGEVEYQHEGQTDKFVSISQKSDSINFGLDFAAFLLNPENKLRWDVGLSPNVPIQLDINSGTGGSTLDLSELQLTGLSIDSGTGGMTINLPVMATSYDVQVSSGTGGGTINLQNGTIANLDINSGTGGFTIDVPDEAAVRVIARTGVGGINVPSNYSHVDGNDDNFVGENGTWETPGFENAENQIIINFEGGTGGLSIR